MKIKKSLKLFFIFLIVGFSLLSLFLTACEKEAITEPMQESVNEPFAQASNAEILQQYPDDLDEALEELEVVEE